MPLTDIVRHLNRQNQRLDPGFNAQEPFLITSRGILARFADFHIEFLIHSYSDTRGKLCGYAADICAHGAISRQVLDSRTLFLLARSNEEYIYLDRLLRTLHLLNYLHLHLDAAFLLKLHPRLAATAASHRGLGFDEILQACHLVPERITFDFDLSGIQSVQDLRAAIDIYRARGYGIAVSGVERSALNIKDLCELQADIVTIDAHPSRSPGELLALSKAIGASGGKSLISALLISRETAARCGIDLLLAPTPVFSGHDEHPATGWTRAANSAQRSIRH